MDLMGRVRNPLIKFETKEEQVPKGFVPMLVGEESELERVMVHVSLLKDPCMCSLLEMAGEEIGFGQQGIIRIPCDVQHFRWIVNEISKAA